MGECTDSEMEQYRTASAPLLANEDALDDLPIPKTNPRKRKGVRAGAPVPLWKEGAVPIGKNIGFYQPVNFIQRRASDFPITAPSVYQYLNDGKPFELLVISVGWWMVPDEPMSHCGIMACRTIGSGEWSRFRLENAFKVHTMQTIQI